MRRVWAVIVLALAVAIARADAPAEATVTDADGKEIKATGLKYGPGTHRLAWLADPGGATDEAKRGPLALELREPHSTTLKVGILTYVPLTAVESIKYDYEKQLAAVAVKGVPEPLAGTLQYKGVNAFNFDGTADGKAAKFGGGALTKGNIKAVAFLNPQPLPPRAPAQWLVQIDHPKAMDPTLKVGNIKFLYRYAGGAEVLADAGIVRKGDPLKLDAVTQYIAVAFDPTARVAVAEVQTGDKERLVVIPADVETDGKKGTLVGLLGEVDAGWKLFPLHTIKSMKRPKKD